MEVLTGIAVSVAGWLCFAVVHLLWWRFSARGPGDALRFVVCMLVGYAAALLVSWRRVDDLQLLIWSSMPFYLLMMVMYGHFYVGILRSVSVRILGELDGERAGFMTWAELDRRYPKVRMFEDRLAMLVQTRFLVREGQHYRCSGRGIFVAGVMMRLAGIYRLAAAG